MIRRSLPVVLALALLPSFAALAQLPGTLFGLITDENGEPIPGVKITVTDPEAPHFLQEEMSDDRGRYTLFVTNSLPSYSLSFSKEGFRGLNLTGVKISARTRTRRNFEMRSLTAAEQEAAQAPTGGEAPEAKGGGFLKSYNEGVAALDAGDLATAKMRFEETLDKQPEYGPAHGGLARVYWKQENWAEAAKWGESSMKLNPDDTEINQVLYAAYSGLGQKDKAEAVLETMQSVNPEKAGKNMFNHAADLYNAGNIAEAKPIFEQIIAVDPGQARAHYMLGMCYVNEGDNEKAKAELGKFIELAPNDPDAALAKEMMQYLE